MGELLNDDDRARSFHVEWQLANLDYIRLVNQPLSSYLRLDTTSALRVDVVLTILSQIASVLIGVSHRRVITCEVLSWLWMLLCFKQVRQISYRYIEDSPITSICKVGPRTRYKIVSFKFMS